MQGKSSGFRFLEQSAGFGINFHLIPYDEENSILRVFFVGILNTLLVSVLGIISATLLGFAIGLARLSKNFILRVLATIYIEVFRNIPLLLQLFCWYFLVLRPLPYPRESLVFKSIIFLNNRGLYLPQPSFHSHFLFSVLGLGIGLFCLFLWSKKIRQETGNSLVSLKWLCLGSVLFLLIWVYLYNPIHWTVPVLKGFNVSRKGVIWLSPELMALWVALTVYTASFIAEIVRAGILSVAKGQKEAALSLGLPHNVVTSRVIIPQALKVIIPPLTSQYLNLTKNSSLAVAIAYPDLISVFSGTALNQTGQEIEIIAMTMLVYISCSLTISTVMNYYNHKVSWGKG